MLKELKKPCLKNLKEDVGAMSHDKENTNKFIRTIKKNQIEILEQKTIITKMKNSLKRLHQIFYLTKEITHKLKNRSIEII